MTDPIRQQIKAILGERRMTQTELAQLSDVREDYVSKLLRGERGGIPKEWEKILDALGLELYVGPKGQQNEAK